jgi:DNA-binding transcriptional ArsR family regulator
LNTKRALVVLTSLALTIIVAGCFAAQIYQQQNFSYTESPTRHISVSSIASLDAITINQYTLLAFPPSLTVQTSGIGQTALANFTRSQIFSYVSQNPGVQFRAIASALCLPVGLAEYHLGVLMRAGLVSFVRDGRYKRFFVSKKFSRREMALICLLRRRTPRKIFEALLSKRRLSHCKLAGEVAITSQALTWQMKTLKDTRFILQVNDGLRTVYSLNETSAPMLEKYLAVVEPHPF